MGISLDLEDGNQLGLVVQVVGAASQRYDLLRTATHSECIWHANSQHKANAGL
jgi:hypothetical protein